MLPPKHSVILGSYNRPRMIRAAIQSVMDQTKDEWELIVTDDGSNEETISSILECFSSDPRCRLMKQPHQDDAKRRPDCGNRAVQRINDAIPLVRGEIVHYLADDDWYALDRFATFDGLFSNPEIVCGYGRLLCTNASGEQVVREIYYPEVPDPYCHLDHNQVAHRSLVFRKHPRWNPDVGDWASEGRWFQLLSRTWKFNGIDHVVAYKRFHGRCMQATQEGSDGVRESYNER